MKKENHNEEIRATRVGGFGGSDAQLLLDIAACLQGGRPLTTTQKRRIRIAKGIDSPRPDFTTEAIESGRAFEDEVASCLYRDPGPDYVWDRETFLVGTEVHPQNFAVFAHADFCDVKSMSVKEVKWTRVFRLSNLLEKYAAQLQWYYLCGAKSVSLIYRCEVGATIQGCVDIPRDDTMQLALKEAVQVVDANWSKMDLDIKEVRENELPPSVRVSVEELINATRKKREIERKIEILKETISVYFIETTSRRILGDSWSLSYKDANEKLVFDEKSLAASYPDLYASFLVKLSKNKASINVNLK